MASPANAREIFTLASKCSELFRICACADQEPLRAPSNGHRDVASLSKDFEAWCFNLGVFAVPKASLDQTLRYSDEIQGFVTQLLSILHRNLEFIKIHGLSKNLQKSAVSRPSQKNKDAVEKPHGSTEEALRAISAVLQRLDRLGATIRKYSASNLSSRVKAFAEQDNDEEYRLLAKKIVTFKYPTAPSSLHDQLAGSMAYRRLRLRYIRQHQLKTAPKGWQDSNKRDHGEQGLSNPKPTNVKLKQPAPKDRAAALRNQAVYRPKGNISSKDAETTPSTTAWTLRQTGSAIERVRRDDIKSVISSSKASTTHMVGHLDDYPEPPTHDQWSQDPKCPTCWRQLIEAELKGKKWRHHVDTDCEPYVCISEDCKQPLHFFSDLTLWENHMRNLHSSKWTQLIHKPTVWICDVDHDDEEFQDHESFQAHLRQNHADMSEADRKAVATLCETQVTRPKHTCPLCGYDLALQQENHPEPASNTPQEKDMDQLAKLANHIGGHIRCLAFDTLDHLASDHESEPGTDTTSGKARSRSRPPRELQDLEDISSGFLDDDDPRSVSTFDELKTRHEGDFTLDDDDTSLQIVSILPKFEEDWKGIRETRSDEEDPILHNMMAYSLWDRAYDNLKKAQPLLVENYEILLSEELAKDAEKGSKPVVNQFHGANIHTRRALLVGIMDELLKRLHDKCRAKQGILQMLDWLAESASPSPKASLLMVGFCLNLSILADVGVKEEFDLTRFVKATSKLPHCFAIEHGLSGHWHLFNPHTSSVVQFERHFCQLLQNMLEFQLRIVNSGGQLAKPGDAGRLPSEDDNLEIPDIDQCLSLPGLHARLLEIQENTPWAEDTIFEAIRALGPAKRVYSPTDQENLRRLHRVLRIDPRKVKDQIETIGGGLLKDSPRWLLNHGDFHWFQNDPQTRSLYISGPPGTGKTMLLCGLIDELSAKQTALSYFFCRASDPKLNSGADVLRGLLYLLACERPSLLFTYDLLGEQLIEDASTWKSLADIVSTILEDPLLEGAVLVVDALDECFADRDSLIQFTKKPSRVKWIISSLDLPDIVDASNDPSQVTLRLGAYEDDMPNVLETYIQRKLDILAREKNLDQETRGATHHLLVSKSQGSFLCIDLFIQDLIRIQPDQMIQRLSSLPSSLGPLYMELIKSILNSPRSSLCKRILAIAAVVFRPVTLKELRNLDVELQDVNEGILEELISTCGPLLTLQERAIRFVHHSAKRFLRSSAAHLILPLGLADQHYRLFFASIKCLDNTLHENIYSLRNPGVHIDEVPRLDPDPLLAVRYSCIYWADHLAFANVESPLHHNHWDSRRSLHAFLKAHLLHWFEALSLLHRISGSLVALQNLLVSRVILNSPELLALIGDARSFLLSHEETITDFPLQVYVSALLFSPDQSIVKRIFNHQTSTWIASLPRIRGSWNPPAVDAHERPLLSMAWSWDTQRVVSGSRDGTITMWDTDADVCLGNIRNHGTRVNLVAFSTDGRRFASASSDGLIKVWDTETCRCQMGLFGNVGTANRVVFSADSRLLAAAFSDGLVKIWEFGAALETQVLNRRGTSTEAVVFSADRRMLAFGSNDGFIVLWDVAARKFTRELVVPDTSVASLGFSADGEQLASSYVDGTLRVWGPVTGSLFHVVKAERIIRHLSFDPTASHCLSTDIGRLEISSSGEASFPGYSLSADNCWILKDGKRVLLIPSKYRSDLPCGLVVRGSMVGLVSDSADILTMRFA